MMDQGTPAQLLATVLLTVASLLLLRESWCHTYYPLRGRLYLAQDMPELAAVAWRAYLATWTLWGRRRKRAARFSLAHCEYRLGHIEAALAECERVLAEAGDPALSGMAQQMRADCLDRLGRPDEAREARQTAGETLRSHDPNSLYARELEIDRLEQDGHWREALEQLEELVQDALRTGSEDYLHALRLRLARVRLQRGFYEAAAMTAETLLARGGLATELQHDAHLVAARAYLEQERLDQAERDAESSFRTANLAADREKLIDDCLALAEIALHRGDYVTAMRNYQRVRECGGHGRWLAAIGEGELLDLWGRTDEADRAFDQAARNLPTGEPAASAALVVALAHAAVIAPRDPAGAVALLAPILTEPIHDPRLAVRRDGLVAAVLTRVGRGDETAAAREGIARGRQEFAHDRHLQVELDADEAELALAEGRPAEAGAFIEQALDRPCYRILRPTLLLRLGDARRADGDEPGVREAWEAAAEHPIELGAVMEARRRLDGLAEPRA